MKKVLILVISLFISRGFCALADTYDLLIPHTKNEYYKNKLIHKMSPDYLRKLKINNIEYTFLSFAGGSHLGILYIILQDKPIHTIECGPIFAVLSQEEMAFLASNEVIIVTSTGGTGEHHVFGQIMSFGENISVVATYPLSGYSCQVSRYIPEEFCSKESISSLEFHYKIQSLTLQNNTLIANFEFISIFNNVEASHHEEILHSLDLKSAREPFTITIDSNRTSHFEGSEGIKKFIQP